MNCSAIDSRKEISLNDYLARANRLNPKEAAPPSDFHISIRRVGIVGTNFKYSPISVGEKLARDLTLARLLDLKMKARENEPAELVLLSTCNRSEIYYYQRSSSSKLSIEAENLFRQNVQESSQLYHYTGLSAIKHLFEVACGLDSLVIGEEQILAQVGEAIKLSARHGLAGPILSKLFSAACDSGRKVRETNSRFVSGQYDSISSAVIELVYQRFHKEYKPNLLVVGTGKTAKLTVNKVDRTRFGTVVVAARNLKYLSQLEADAVVPLSQLHQVISEKKINVIITATSADSYIISREQLEGITSPLLIVDISNPRNVDPSVRDFAKVNLLNLDDLKPYVKPLSEVDGEILSKINESISIKMMEFMAWMVEYEEILPLLSALRRNAERIRSEEINNAFSRSPDLSAEQKVVINKMTERLVRRLLHEPSLNLKEMLKGEDLGRIAQYKEAILNLFAPELIEGNVSNMKSQLHEKENNDKKIHGDFLFSSVKKEAQ